MQLEFYAFFKVVTFWAVTIVSEGAFLGSIMLIFSSEQARYLW